MANRIIIDGKAHRYSWLNTIFVQIDDFDLLDKIGEFSRDMDCKLEFGRADSPGLMAAPFFYGIVDRRLVGGVMWEEVLDFRSEYGGHKPLIVIDTENGMDAGKTRNIIYTKSHTEILLIITKRKNWLNRIEFIYYNSIYHWLSEKWSLLDLYWYEFKSKLSRDSDS